MSLLNTYDRLSKYVASINNFEQMYNERANIKDVSEAKEGDCCQQQGKVVSFFQNNNFFRLLRQSILDTVHKLNGSTNITGGSKSQIIGEMKTKSEMNSKNKAKKELNFPDATHSYFADLKMPYKEKEEINPEPSHSTDFEESVWIKAWHIELHNVYEALYFIYKSYLDLPRNIWNILVINFNKLWNIFIGVTGYLDKEEKDPKVYELHIK